MQPWQRLYHVLQMVDTHSHTSLLASSVHTEDDLNQKKFQFGFITSSRLAATDFQSSSCVILQPFLISLRMVFHSHPSTEPIVFLWTVDRATEGLDASLRSRVRAFLVFFSWYCSFTIMYVDTTQAHPLNLMKLGENGHEKRKKKVSLPGSKIWRNEGWLKIFALYCIAFEWCAFTSL